MTPPLDPFGAEAAAPLDRELVPRGLRAARPRLPAAALVAETFRALRHRNFQLYFFGQLISVAGTWMQLIAQGWLVYQISHSESTLGLVAFAAAIPALIVSPWGGVFVDRIPKRALLVATQTAAMLLALILSALAFTHTVQVWHVVALAAGLGLVNAFDGPGRQAFVVEMVGRDDMTNAIALNSMMFNGARIIGPAIGGVLLAAFGPAWCFLLNGLSYLAVIAGLLAMRLSSPARVRLVGPWKAFVDGLRYVAAHGEQLALLLIASCFAVFGLAYGALLPAFADRVLHTGAAGFGLLNAATGAGSLVGALIIAAMRPGRRGQWLFVATLLYPLVLFGFAFAGWLPAALALALGLGLLFMIHVTLINTLLQVHVSDELRGRVLSLFILIFFGFAPFGNLLAGGVAERIGLSATIGGSAVIAEVLCVVVFASAPALRKLR